MENFEKLLKLLPQEVVQSQELTMQEKLILGKYVKLSQSDLCKEKGYCYRLIRDLMSDINAGWTTVENGLAKLEKLGCLTPIEKTPRGATKYKVNVLDYARKQASKQDEKSKAMPSPPSTRGEGLKRINVDVGKTDSKAKDILSSDTQRIVKNVESFNAPKKFKRLPQDSIEEKVLTYLLTVTENGVKHYTTTFPSVERLLDYAKGAFQHLIEQHHSKNGVGGGLSDEQLCKCLKYAFDYYQTIAKETFHNELVVVCYKLGKPQKPFYTVVLKKPIQAKQKIEIEAKDELEESAEAPILSEDEKLLELVLAQDIPFKTYLSKLTNTWGINSYKQQCTKKVETAAVENSAKEVLKKLISEECEKRSVALQKSSAVG